MIAPLLLLALSAQAAPPPPPFTGRCATCHGDEAGGTARAPGLVMNPRVAVQSVEQLRACLQRGNPGAGMPAFADLPVEDLLALARYLRRINVETIIPPPAAAPTGPIAWRPPQPGDWRTYNGNDTGNRDSALTQITRANVASLKLKWVFPMPYFGLEVTPLAADGVLYVTGPNQVVALDATNGRALWTYSRPPTPGQRRGQYPLFWLVRNAWRASRS
jgi:cytochrome c553